MSESLSEIKDERYKSLKEVCRSVSYSKDYIAKLAREKKIDAKLVNRQWYVDVDSLKNFAFLAECEQKIRSRRLSAERKREQQIKKAVEKISKTTDEKVLILPRKVNQRLAGVVAASLALGFLINTTFLSNDFNINNSHSLTSNLQYAVNKIFAGKQVTTPAVTEGNHPSIFSDITITEEVIHPEQYEGVLLLTGTTMDVEGLFSDPVKVEMISEREGKVSLEVDSENQESNGIDFVVVKIPAEESKVSEKDYDL